MCSYSRPMNPGRPSAYQQLRYVFFSHCRLPRADCSLSYSLFRRRANSRSGRVDLVVIQLHLVLILNRSLEIGHRTIHYFRTCRFPPISITITCIQDRLWSLTFTVECRCDTTPLRTTCNFGRDVPVVVPLSTMCCSLTSWLRTKRPLAIYALCAASPLKFFQPPLYVLSASNS